MFFLNVLLYKFTHFLAFSSTYFYAHFKMLDKKILDGNAKIRINSKNVHKMHQLSWINCVSSENMQINYDGNTLPNKFLSVHQKRYVKCCFDDHQVFQYSYLHCLTRLRSQTHPLQKAR